MSQLIHCKHFFIFYFTLMNYQLRFGTLSCMQVTQGKFWSAGVTFPERQDRRLLTTVACQPGVCWVMIVSE